MMEMKIIEDLIIYESFKSKKPLPKRATKLFLSTARILREVKFMPEVYLEQFNQRMINDEKNKA